MSELIAAGLYFLVVTPLFVFARRRRVVSAWLAFVPIANWAIAGAVWNDEDEPQWGRGALLLVLAFVPLVFFVEMGALWARAVVRTGQNRWLGLLCAIPPMFCVLPWVIALRAPRLSPPAYA